MVNYRWKLVASNGRATASSGESFASKSNAREAAESVEASDQDAAHLVVEQRKVGLVGKQP